MSAPDHAAVVRERLREKVEGVLLISKNADGTETVFCGDGPDGEYIGWQPRLHADQKGWSYRAPSDPFAAETLAALDALVAEVERMTAEADRWCDRADQAEMRESKERRRAEAAEAERDEAIRAGQEIVDEAHHRAEQLALWAERAAAVFRQVYPTRAAQDLLTEYAALAASGEPATEETT